MLRWHAILIRRRSAYGNRVGHDRGRHYRVRLSDPRTFIVQ